MLLIAGALSLVRIYRSGPTRRTVSLWLLAVLGGMTLLPAYLPMAPIRLYQCGYLAWIAAGVLLTELCGWASSRRCGWR